MLRAEEPRRALIDALARVERLVLLGDVLELRHGPLRDALDAATPVLSELGEALGADGEIVLLPGNHDHRLLRGWLERRAAQPEVDPLGLESLVQWSPGEPLAALAAAVGPASLRVYYPGRWLRDDVYAIHGHYLDRHITVPILERLGAGLMARVIREAPAGPQGAEDYEATLGSMYAWLDAVAQTGARGRAGAGVQVRAWEALHGSRRRRSIRGLGLGVAFPSLVWGLNRAGIGPVGRDVSGPELRRAGLRAFEEVLSRLGARCSYAIFGHTHRAGPLAGDVEAEWRTPSGARLFNTGCWMAGQEGMGGTPSRSPYRPGFACRLEDEGPPELVNLLDR